MVKKFKIANRSASKEKCTKGYFDCGVSENGNRRCIHKKLECDKSPSCGVVGRNLDEVNCRGDDGNVFKYNKYIKFINSRRVVLINYLVCNTDHSDEDNDDSHEEGGDRDNDDDDDDDDDAMKILPYALPIGIFLITLLVLVVCWRRWKQHKIQKVGNTHVVMQSTGVLIILHVYEVSIIMKCMNIISISA